MRTAILRSVSIAGTFVSGVVCGLLLRSAAGSAGWARLPRVPEIGIGTRGRRRRFGATRPPARLADATGSDESWDTYQSGADADEAGGTE